MPSWGIRVNMAAPSMLLCVDGLHRAGLTMCAVPCGMAARPEHGEHAVGDGITACGIARAEQHGNEADDLLLYRTRVQERIDAAHHHDAVYEIRARHQRRMQD